MNNKTEDILVEFRQHSTYNRVLNSSIYYIISYLLVLLISANFLKFPYVVEGTLIDIEKNQAVFKIESKKASIIDCQVEIWDYGDPLNGNILNIGRNNNGTSKVVILFEKALITENEISKKFSIYSESSLLAFMSKTIFYD
jgi:hypothetical protein